MEHELKIYPQYYCRVKNGTKTFEVRKNDRGFQPGDTVILREWDPTVLPSYDTPKGYTKSPVLAFEVGYVYHLDAERVIFSLLKINQP